MEEVVRNEYAPAIFTQKNFRFLRTLQFFLRGDAVVATSASAALDRNDRLAALRLLDSFVPLDILVFDAREDLLALVLQLQFFLLVFLVDLAQFLLLLGELAVHFFVLRRRRFQIRLEKLHPSFQKFHFLLELYGLGFSRLYFSRQRVVLLVRLDVELLPLVLLNLLPAVDDPDIRAVTIDFRLFHPIAQGLHFRLCFGGPGLEAGGDPVRIPPEIQYL